MSNPAGEPSAESLQDTLITKQNVGPMQQTVVAAEGTIGQDTSPTAPGSVIGDFKIARKLGQGGMGAVFLAHQMSLDRECALKVMARELADKPGFVERFVREARSMAKMQHPNVVSCYAVGTQAGTHFVAMEFIDGKSMQGWLNELKQLSVADALLVTIVVAEALQHAHDLKMIHRDIKPDNILVTKSGVVKVADLGLAKATDEDMSMTQSGMGLGTPHYMPPEQARNAKHVDHRCDVYALGVTLYHFLTGQVPFSGDSVIELIANKEKGTFTAAHKVNRDIPERLSLMIDRSMAKNSKARYQSMTEFVRDLRSLGLAGSALSFAQGPRSNASGVSSASAIRAAPRLPGTPKNRSSASGAGMSGVSPAPAAAAGPETTSWYVKVVRDGKPATLRMTSGQILAAIKTDKIETAAQVAASPNGPFLPLPQVPAFADAARKMIHRQQSRGRSLAGEIAKLEKQYDRRKWWQMLARFRDGTLGLVGLVLYLAVAAALIGGLAYYAPAIWKFMDAQFRNIR
ncbi:serine/threonine protein kinase [Planctomyces sp. SH-PL14]|uniref:serine/threonine protein kinase n=1 Tax=Planctomyces sp. SH-PL14 TaxID=1632864 RepID=UPI00078DA12B|nr:serine/threonine-protein kinase [Planctomyces sp. SH-PL14]AMV19888.1 Serine/threonine-protein kinase PrkC [Planctomyces sp. SH-PL14]